MKLDPFKYIISKRVHPLIFKWEGKEYHSYLKQKSEELIKQKKSSYLNKNINKIVCIDYPLLEYLVRENIINENYYLNNGKIIKIDHQTKQYVQEHNENDHILLEKCLKSKRPIEVMNLIINTFSNEKLISPIFKGNHSSVSNQIQIQEWFHKSIFETKKNGHSIHSLEINHTHTSLEFTVSNDKGNLIVTNGLGRSDLIIAKSVSEHFNYPLAISAIIPSGLKYTAIF